MDGSRTSTRPGGGELAGVSGEPDGRLHTARSRNDQIATIFGYLYARRRHGREDILEMQAALLQGRARTVQTVMPGYTHTQRARRCAGTIWLAYGRCSTACGSARDACPN